MGNCFVKQELPPYSQKSTCFCCFPWSNRAIPEFSYDEVDDTLEFETLLTDSSPAGQMYTVNSRPNSNNLIWEKIAGLFSGFKRGRRSPKGYQAVMTVENDMDSDDHDSLFGNDAEVQVLTEEQIEQITQSLNKPTS